MASRSTRSSPRRSRPKSRAAACTAGRLSQSHDERVDRLTPLELARRIAGLAQEKLAGDVVILDMTPVCTFTDYFVICTGQNPRQTKSIHDEVHTVLKAESRTLPVNMDGVREATWIVADYLDVVLHVFTSDARKYYALEELWGDVPSVSVEAVSA